MNLSISQTVVLPNTWQSIGGQDTVLHQIYGSFLLPLLQSDIYTRYGVFPPRGILLYGPPGTGKSLIIQNLQGEIEYLSKQMQKSSFPKVVSIQASQCLYATAGATERYLSELFESCNLLAIEDQTYTLLCIDEIDLVCPNRDTANEIGFRSVTTLLNLMDQYQPPQRGRVLLIGTTNRLNTLDPAIRRAGRMELEIEVGVPTLEGRVDTLNKKLLRVPHDLDSQAIYELAGKCQAFVGADIESWVSSACFHAIRESLEEAFKTNDLTSQKEPNSISETEKKVNISHFENALQLIKPSGMKELAIEIPHVKWTDIGGYDQVKESLIQCVEWPIRYHTLFQKLHLMPPRGILLYGPPGCSKTMMAKAVATESSMNFIAIKGPELFSKWVGESEKAIRDLFRKARQNAPCVIFFDEMDALGCARELSTTEGVSSRVLSQLLNEMDGVSSCRGVLVIGATNRPDMLDSALLRPGRLDRLVYIPLPNTESRTQIFLKVLQQMPLGTFPIEMDEAQPKDQTLSVAKYLANRTEGYSGAEIIMICREVSMLVLRQSIQKFEKEKTDIQSNAKALQVESVTFDHFKEILQTVGPRTPVSLIEYFKNFEKQVAGSGSKAVSSDV